VKGQKILNPADPLIADLKAQIDAGRVVIIAGAGIS
jgi:hypothetical protein